MRKILVFILDFESVLQFEFSLGRAFSPLFPAVPNTSAWTTQFYMHCALFTVQKPHQ